MPDKRAACIALTVLFIFTPAFAQQPTRPATDKDALSSEAARELERRAVSLLEEAVAGAQELKLAENRVRVLSTASALLWLRDEEAARELFMQAADTIRLILQSYDAFDQRAYERSQSIWFMRNELLQIVANRDPRLALEFIRTTRQPPQYHRLYDGMKPPDQELALETDLAARIAMQDPKEAARMIEDNLRRGHTANLPNALMQLAQKDPEAASKLTAAAIARLRPEDLLGIHDVSNLASQLMALTRPPDPAPSTQPGDDERRGRTRRTDRIEVDAASRRALIETLVNAALNSTGNRGFLYPLYDTLRNVMPEVERYAPSRVAAVRRHLSEFERTQDPRRRHFLEYQQLFQEKDPTALIAAAEKAPREIRDDLYRAAALRLYPEDFERGRAAAEKISNPQQRVQLLRELEQQRPWRAAERGEFELARRLAASLSSPDQRAKTLVAIARAAFNRGQKQDAAAFLDEARAQFGPRVRNRLEMEGLLEMAGLYASFDPKEAFVILEAAVMQLNELIAASAVVDGFTGNDFSEGEIPPHRGVVWHEFIHRTAAGLAALAVHDFERARDAVRSFDRADTRVMAKLHLAHSILMKVSPPRTEGGTTNRLYIVSPVRGMMH